MAIHNIQIEDIDKQIAALQAKRQEAVQARRAGLGELIEKMGLAGCTDAELAGALKVLIGATDHERERLATIGSTFLDGGKRRRGSRVVPGVVGQAGEGSA